jgi:DNA-binding response OmpR family regulator
VDLALVYIQDVLDGAQSPPDLLVLDLGFADESGFEVLRFLRTNKAFPAMRVIVWTCMGETQKELCGFFGVEFLSKLAGVDEFERIVKTAAA